MIERLQARLEEVAGEKTKDRWERYQKRTASFRGVPMPAIRRGVAESYREEGLVELPAGERNVLALELIGESHSEDKLAGVLLLREHLIEGLGIEDLAPFAAASRAGHISAWNVCDSFSVKVFAALIEPNGPPMAEAIAAWRASEPRWRRRAAAVALAPLAPEGEKNFDGFVDLAIGVADANVRDPEMFMQRSVGWLLRELSKADPDTVRAFVAEHEALLSREARRMALAKLEGRGRR